MEKFFLTKAKIWSNFLRNYAKFLKKKIPPPIPKSWIRPWFRPVQVLKKFWFSRPMWHFLWLKITLLFLLFSSQIVEETVLQSSVRNIDPKAAKWKDTDLQLVYVRNASILRTTKNAGNTHWHTECTSILQVLFRLKCEFIL